MSFAKMLWRQMHTHCDRYAKHSQFQPTCLALHAETSCRTTKFCAFNYHTNHTQTGNLMTITALWPVRLHYHVIVILQFVSHFAQWVSLHKNRPLKDILPQAFIHLQDIQGMRLEIAIDIQNIPEALRLFNLFILPTCLHHERRERFTGKIVGRFSVRSCMAESPEIDSPLILPAC
jgi:hypothetical protein